MRSIKFVQSDYAINKQLYAFFYFWIKHNIYTAIALTE